MQHVHWNKCQGDVWCQLNSVSLQHAHFDQMDGVYIIWHGGPKAKTVYVGSGNIRDRITYHRKNPDIQKFAPLGLYVTWARVEEPLRKGIEAFLAVRLSPIAGGMWPERDSVAVNLPW